jgi:hypothetical protein
MELDRRSSDVGRTLRAGGADRVEGVADFGDGLIWRRAGARRRGRDRGHAGRRDPASSRVFTLARNWRIDRFGCDFRLGKGSLRQ